MTNRNKAKNIIDKKTNKLKKVYILITFLIILGLTAFKIMYDINTNRVIKAKDDDAKEAMSLSTIVNNDDYVLQRINEKYKNSNIEVYYPVTKYEVLNNEIKRIIDDKIVNFKSFVKDDSKYSLLINFDMYKYNNYIGFVFHTLEDFSGAHPNTYIFTVNYDIKNNCTINIDTLVKQNNNILNLMSKYSFNNLSLNNKIKEINLPYMLSNGTKPTKNNFKNFIFTKDGITVFFERYQIAPYAYGEFSIIIPFIELNLKVED